MLSIQINNLGKKFNREWIFQQLSYTIAPGQKLAILGGNGSGKSTFLQVISGFVMPNAGEITYTHVQPGSPDKIISTDRIKDLVAFASPYLQLIEELTLRELVDHVRIYKPFLANLNRQQVIDKMELSHAANKPVKQFSSGMKQRLKLGLAVLSDTPLLLLDEPVSNLDREAIRWYQQVINEHARHRTVLVCSNAIAEEYTFCPSSLTISDFKPEIPKN